MPRSPKRPDRKIQEHQEQIGRRVRQARTAKGWTREKLAEALGVEVETLWRYEAGRLPLSVAALYQLSDILDVRIERLVGRGPVGVTSAEAELLEHWRMLDPEGQRLVLEMFRWGFRPHERAKPAKRSKTLPSHSSP
jgi:transcriptional regulator with XRE-family HTH domain